MGCQANIYLIASYPKSGNTWTRAFFDALLFDQVDINGLSTTIASDRDLIERCLGIETSELSADEIELLRPLAYRQLSDDIHVEAARNNKCVKSKALPFLLKAHDAYHLCKNNKPLFPSSAIAGAIVIVRNPLDIAVSYANHANTSIDKAIDSLCSELFTFSPSRLNARHQVRERLGLWSSHTQSWLAADLPKLIIRYEDMVENACAEFSRMTDFLGMNTGSVEIQNALEASSFEALSKQERDKGFREKAPKVKRFFNNGKVGAWQASLSKAQIKKVINANAESMINMGYLTNSHELTDVLFIR